MVAYLVGSAVMTLDEAARKIGGNAQDLQASSELIASFIGICMIIGGLIKLASDKRQNASQTAAWTLIIFGSLTFSVGVASWMVLNSVVGDEALEEFEESYGVL